jgi:hypothetical protein
MTLLRHFRARYGAGPFHLVMLLASFAIAGVAVAGWFQRPREVGTVLVWFAAAIVVHDLVLLPLYSMLDRIAFRSRRDTTDDVHGHAGRRLVNPAPYVRIPAILSGLLLLVFFPVILGLGAHTEFAASGIAERGYLARWLLATGVMFALSGAAYAVAVSRTDRPPEACEREPVQSGRVAAADATAAQTAAETAPDPNQIARDPAATPPDPAEEESALGAAAPTEPKPAAAAPDPTEMAPEPVKLKPADAAPGDASPPSPAPE